MSRICDRSPCDQLLHALGVWIFGYSDKPGFFIVAATETVDLEVAVDYCPFCGTRLDEVGRVIIEKFTRQKKRRRARAPAA